MVKMLPVIRKYTYSGLHVNTVNAVIAGGYNAGGVQDTLAHSNIIVYSSIEYDHREVVDAVREATNNAPLILIVIPRSLAVGRFIEASSSGEFTEKRVKSGSVAVDCFKKVLPRVPMLNWEAYGEIRLEPGQFSGLHNTT